MNNTYQIVRGMQDFYLAKKTKGNVMSQQRYKISRSEIFNMFLTLMREQMDEEDTNIITITKSGEPEFEIKQLKGGER